MVKIITLLKKGRISRISDLEIERYVNFFENSYRENLEHSKFNINKFPRWSIISGYYAMHDISKLLFAKKFRIKIESKVHITTIIVLRELIKNKHLVNLMKQGYKEFLALANDLEEAKKERVKAQYYTRTSFMKEQYQKGAIEFNENVVIPFVEKIKEVIA